MIPRFARVRSNYPPELMQLALLLAVQCQTREVAALLGVPLSTVYRWRANHKHRPLLSPPPLPCDARLAELVRVCERRGVRLAQSLRLRVQAPQRAPAEHITQQAAPHHAAVLPGGVGEAHARGNVISISDEIRRRVALVRDKVDTEYFTHLSCDHFARIASMSKYNLINRFSQVYGISPYRYLLQVRIRHAKKLLFSTQASLGAIATAVGFDSQSSLSKSFRSIEGITLAQFRRIVSGRGTETVAAAAPAQLRSA